MVAGEFGSPGVIELTRSQGHNKEAVAALRALNNFWHLYIVNNR